MHRACAVSGNETIGTRQQRTIADLTAELSAARESERRLRILHQSALQRAVNSERNARVADERVDNAGAERDLAVERETLAVMARDSAVRERDAARAELAKRPVPTQATPPTQTQTESDDRDASEIRFSLLDLD